MKILAPVTQKKLVSAAMFPKYLPLASLLVIAARAAGDDTSQIKREGILNEPKNDSDIAAAPREESFIHPKPFDDNRVAENAVKIDINDLGNGRVQFVLYGRDNWNVSEEREVFVNKKDDLIAAGFDPLAPTKIICHGFESDFKSGPGALLIPAYIEAIRSSNKTMNIIAVNWSYLAAGKKTGINDAPVVIGMGVDRESRGLLGHFDGWLESSKESLFAKYSMLYFAPAGRTEEAGNNTGKFIQFLVKDVGVNVKDLHLIGHSLGAQVMGYAARFVKDNLQVNVPRITALDPAGPCFEKPSGYFAMLKRPPCLGGSFIPVGKNDAEFVDAIHTNAGGPGMARPVGHADFYPNSGSQQKGCPETSFLSFWKQLDAAVCNHGRSIELMRDSIAYPHKRFNAFHSSDWNDFQKQRCGLSRTSPAVMGEHCSPDTRGRFYLETAEKSPFALEALSGCSK